MFELQELVDASPGGDAMYGVMGSLAFVAVARAGYAVLKDAKDDMGERRLVLPIKNNLGDDKSGLAYRIMEAPGHDQPYVAWEPEAVYMTVSEALGAGTGKGGARDPSDDREQRKLQVAEAAEWLDGYLADGGKPAREIIEAAKVDGISQRILERAKPQAHVVACREGFAQGGRWVWRKVDTEALVEQAKAATNAQGHVVGGPWDGAGRFGGLWRSWRPMGNAGVFGRFWPAKTAFAP